VLLAGSEAHVYLASRFAWIRTASAAKILKDSSQGEEIERIEAPNWQLVLEAACRILGRRPKRPYKVKIWLSGEFARPFVLPVNVGLRSCNESQLLAKAHAVDATGLHGPCAVWLNNWRAGQPCLAVAVTQEIVDTTCKMMTVAELRLCGIEPAWNRVLSQCLLDKQAITPTGLLAIQEQDALTMMVLEDGQVIEAQSVSPLPLRVEAHLQRQAMSWELPEVKSILAVVSGFSRSSNSTANHFSLLLRQTNMVLFDVKWQEIL
jgi:hypothetical protein